MGSEFAQGTEWNCERELDWYVLDYEHHKGMQTLVSDLNKLYKSLPPLFQHDFDPHGFEWIDCNDREHSTLSYLRKSDNESVVVIFNFTPVPRENYRIGVPDAGHYQVIFNSDSEYYGGSNMGKEIHISEDQPWSDRAHSIELTLPPLAGLVLKKSN
jgi:1,4-alpha-glucan branching enzyme